MLLFGDDLEDAGDPSHMNNLHETDELISAMSHDELAPIQMGAIFAFDGFKVLAVMPVVTALPDRSFIVNLPNPPGQVIIIFGLLESQAQPLPRVISCLSFRETRFSHQSSKVVMGMAATLSHSIP